MSRRTVAALAAGLTLGALTVSTPTGAAQVCEGTGAFRSATLTTDAQGATFDYRLNDWCKGRTDVGLAAYQAEAYDPATPQYLAVSATGSADRGTLRIVFPEPETTPCSFQVDAFTGAVLPVVYGDRGLLYSAGGRLADFTFQAVECAEEPEPTTTTTTEPEPTTTTTAPEEPQETTTTMAAPTTLPEPTTTLVVPSSVVTMDPTTSVPPTITTDATTLPPTVPTPTIITTGTTQVSPTTVVDQDGPSTTTSTVRAPEGSLPVTGAAWIKTLIISGLIAMGMGGIVLAVRRRQDRLA